MADSLRHEEYIPFLARPRMGLAPPGVLAPGGNGPLWRDSLNMTVYDGLLRRRAAIPATSDLGPSVYGITSSPENEIPLLIITAEMPGSVVPAVQTNPPCADVYRPPQASSFLAVVTSRQIFVYNETLGGWANVTPTYSTGTVTATNGSATVTGAGTLWLTRGISPYQFISIEGTWYQICTVTGEGAMTLTSNYGGAGGPGLAYTVRRTWTCHSAVGKRDYSSLVSAAFNNGNLYVAGRFIGRADGQVAPALIRVTNVLGGSPTTAYLTASTALTVGLDAISGLSDITGVQVLQDGRVVMSGNGPLGPSTIFFSSPTNQAVWTVSPAGQTAVVYYEGAIHALGLLGKILTLHYEHGIVLAYPTGLTERPLSYEPSKATDGCVAPHTLRSLGGAEYYVTTSGNVGRFDGAGSVLIGDEPRKAMGINLVETQDIRTMFSGYLSNRNEYTIYEGSVGSGGGFCTLRIDEGTWWPGRIGIPLRAAGEDGILGVRSLDGSTEKNLLTSYVEDTVATDVAAYSSMSNSSIQAESDDWDFGDPERLYTLVAVMLWFRAHYTTPPLTENVTVSASIDGGATWTSVTKSVTALATGETRVHFSFFNLVAASSLIRFRIGPESGVTSIFAYTRMLVIVNKGGRVAQVE